MLKEQCNKIFCFRLFHESSSPKPLKIKVGPFQISKTRCTTGINSTGRKFAAGVNNTCGKCATSINDTGGKFATGTADVVDTGGKFATNINGRRKYSPGLNHSGGKLPLVSTTLGVNLPVSMTLVAKNVNNIRLLTT